MAIAERNVVKTSHYFLWAFLLVVGFFHLTTPLIATLFAYLVLEQLHSVRRKWLALVIYIILVGGLLFASGKFFNEAFRAIPNIAKESMPVVTQYAEKWHIELPFSDFEGLMDTFAGTAKSRAGAIINSFFFTAKEFVYILIALVIAATIYLNSKIDLNEGNYTIKNNLYSILSGEISKRFQTFYLSFRTVMGAQLIISLINTFSTAVFVTAIGLPFAKTVIVVTFLCGLLPIIGNLISNTVITFVAISVSVEKAIFALVFLIILHKGEYFLNSKIIGGRIRNPMWLTLVGLMMGEMVMGIPGMILAPVLLHYIRTECSFVEVKSGS